MLEFYPNPLLTHQGLLQGHHHDNITSSMSCNGHGRTEVDTIKCEKNYEICEGCGQKIHDRYLMRVADASWHEQCLSKGSLLATPRMLKRSPNTLMYQTSCSTVICARSICGTLFHSGKCRRNDLTPRFIMDRVKHLLQKFGKSPVNVKKQASIVSRQLSSSMLNMEISTCCHDIAKIEKSINNLENGLQSIFSIKMVADWAKENEESYRKQLKESNSQLNTKLKKLIQSQDIMENIEYDESFIKNLSGSEIPKEVLTILSLGPKFAITPKELPILDLASDMEHIIKTQVPENESRRVRGDALYTITKFSKENRKLNRIDRFSNSDKGGVVIISKRQEYKDKMRALLEDVESFAPLENDPTKTIKNKINKFMDNLFKAHVISNKVKKSLKTWNTVPPRIFGQIKFHKPGHPLRLIVSTINSAAYIMARFLATLLRKSFKSKFGIKNSKEFVKRIRRMNISEDHVLVSFDVVNCFGNIPVELALEMIDRDFHLIEPHTGIAKEDFMKMLKLCLCEANYFVYEDKFYRQKHGMFMGSSLAPILVERVVEHIVDRTLEELRLEHDFWFTYVDDHLTAVKREMIQVVQDKLNSFHPLVQFTVEVQKDDKSIEFLDTTVYNCNGKIKTRWFHKPIASNRLLNFHSKHPKNMIMNTATAFIKRVFCISHSSFHKENKETIKKILRKNNFPIQIIDELTTKVYSSAQRNNTGNMVSYPFINQTTIVEQGEPSDRSVLIVTNESSLSDDSTPVPNSNSTMITERKQFASMTYVAGLSEKLSKSVNRIAPNLRIAPKPVSQVGELFTDMKQKLTADQQSFVIYRVRCKICSKWYIGETTWCLCDRFATHISDVRNMDKNPRKTALVKYVFDTGPNNHEFDYDGKEILKKVRKKGVIKIHEANQIILHGNETVNFKSDAAHISPVFYNIIKNKSKIPNINPAAPTSYRNPPATDVSTNVDIDNVNINNNNRNVQPRYNLRRRK